jgi:hypothetical protein
VWRQNKKKEKSQLFREQTWWTWCPRKKTEGGGGEEKGRRYIAIIRLLYAYGYIMKDHVPGDMIVYPT